ncbi:MAG: adenylate/guanylate cyclase domain-containing protein [Pseudomonadota bacterium]
MSREALISPIREWLVDESLGNSDVVELFESMCLQMVGVGIPIARARLIWPTLHPLFQAETVWWDYGKSAALDQFEHQDQASDQWNRSPLKFVIDHDLGILRRELEGPNQLLDFELTQDLHEEGFTDFLVMATKLEGTSFRVREGEKNRGILVTWATKKKGGFTADDIWSLQKIQRRFAVACKTVIQSRIASNVATTYLGNRAGNNVLNGQIRRGDGERTKAVVWYSDLRNSTSLAETMEPADYFSLLNSFFMATAEPVVQHGGEILDFIGDAVLGIFPFSHEDYLEKAAKAANLALDEAVERARTTNAERLKSGQEQFKYGIGMNSGEVMFGNIGIPSRLTFSVIGPTVNQVARIEGMTKLIQQTVLADATIASFDQKRWKSTGMHKLEGMLDPVELFAFQCSQTLAAAE